MDSIHKKRGLQFAALFMYYRHVKFFFSLQNLLP